MKDRPTAVSQGRKVACDAEELDRSFHQAQGTRWEDPEEEESEDRNTTKPAYLGEIECLSEEKTIRLPLEDGTMFSKRKGIRPSTYPFSAVPVDSYVRIVGKEKVEKLKRIAEKARGLRILELSLAPIGGCVSEMLLSSVPLLNQLGIDDEWKVIRGDRPFYEVTKAIHDLLQGREGCFTSEMERIYFETLKENTDANLIDYNPDIIIVHDPQPLGLSPGLAEKQSNQTKWVWRCHIDMDEESLRASPSLEYLVNYWLERYDAAIFSAAHYIVCRWPFPKFIIPPFIDPLSEKNRELSQKEIDAVLEKHDIDPDMPIISQVGRFDPWKGIMRTIEAYRIVRQSVECQLVLTGGLAPDDSEGEAMLLRIYQRLSDEPNIHILNLPPTSHLDVNAIQRASQVIMQPSIKEGFGLPITEALWKGKPVIASPVGGIPLQLRDGESGYFYDNPENSAAKIVYLLEHPKAAEVMGRRGADYVRDHFLLPDRIADYLRAIITVKETRLDSESIISYHSWHKLDKRP